MPVEKLDLAVDQLLDRQKHRHDMTESDQRPLILLDIDGVFHDRNALLEVRSSDDPEVVAHRLDVTIITDDACGMSSRFSSQPSSGSMRPSFSITPPDRQGVISSDERHVAGCT